MTDTKWTQGDGYERQVRNENVGRQAIRPVTIMVNVERIPEGKGEHKGGGEHQVGPRRTSSGPEANIKARKDRGGRQVRHLADPGR